MKKFLRLTDDTLRKYKVKNIQELWEKAQKKYKGFEIECFTSFKKSEKDDNKFHAIFSTAKEDRHGDIVKQDWDLKSFKKNPVFIDTHNYDSIEHILGAVLAISAKDGRLQGDIVYALDNPKGYLAYRLTLGGFLNTTSVGFIPKNFDEKGSILKSELLEISAVSVPANPEALIEKIYDGKNNKNKGGDGDTESKGDNSEDSRKKSDEKNGEDKGDKDGARSDKDKARKKDFAENWDNGPNEIRLKVKDIGEFVDDSFQRETLRTIIPRINGISGISRQTGNRVLQSIFFPKEDGWNIDDARKWFSLRQYELLGESFEKKETSKEKKVINYLISIGNKHAEQRKRGIEKVLLAVKAIQAATGEAKFAEADKQQEVKKLINKAAKNILLMKK